MSTIPDLDQTRACDDAWWPPNVPRPDLSLAKYRDRCRSERSVMMMVDASGMPDFTEYPCKPYDCPKHGDKKAASYVQAFGMYMFRLPAIYVGGFRGEWMTEEDVSRGSNAICERARNADRASYVRVKAASDYTWFAGADLSLKRQRADSVAPVFTRVSADQAVAMFRHSLRRLNNVEVSGNQAEPKWRSPDEYHRDGGKSGKRFVAPIPGATEARKAARQEIYAMVVEFLPGPVTNDEREELLTWGCVTGALRHNTPSDVQDAYVQAGEMYSDRRRDRAMAQSLPDAGWPTASVRHLAVVPNDADDERDIA